MMILMREDASAEQVDAVLAKVKRSGGQLLGSQEPRLLAASGQVTDGELEQLRQQPGVERVLDAKPSAAAAAVKMERSVLEIAGRKVGGGHFALIAGPCAVESREQVLAAAHVVDAAGASMFRGGAYKPRTSPYAFQGLGREGLRLLAEAKAQTGLPVVTELIDVRDLEDVMQVADVIQIGARNMQNYPLLAEVGRCGLPVLLKRGICATLDELLLACEYILKEGNSDVMLCERGIRTFETAYRFTLDLTAVPVLKERTQLPVIVDPSHAAGRGDLVRSLSLAAAAAGADGIIVEVHPNPDEAICDGPQALALEQFPEYANAVRSVAALAGEALRTP